MPGRATDQGCVYDFPTMDEFRPNVSRDERSYFGYSRLIPGMNFTCNGKIKKVTVGGVMRSVNKRMKPVRIKFWKESAIEPGIYHKSEKTIVLMINNDMCNEQNRQCMFQLMGKNRISVEPGDILGIEVPPRNMANFELHSVPAPGLTNYIFNDTNPVDLYNRTNETVIEVQLQPLIMLRIDSGTS